MCSGRTPGEGCGPRGVGSVVGLVADGSVVDAERVADAAHGVVRGEAAVVVDAAELVDEGEYFGDAVASLVPTTAENGPLCDG